MRGWKQRGAGMIAALALVLTLGLPASAQDVDAGNWIQLYDGETTFGWIPVGPVEWTVNEGVLTSGEGVGGALVTTSAFKDFELEMRIRVTDGKVGVGVRAPLTDRPQDGGAGFLILEEGEYQTVRVTAAGGEVSATLNQKKVDDFSCSAGIGHIGIYYLNYHGQKNPTVEVESVKLRPLNMSSLFNGENLDGWNIIPDRDSEFNVVDGTLSITDGNGQIETAGLYKNFLFQMDVISNGEHLNSGVFVRGPQGIFWKGLESQIRNQWQGDDRTRPVDFGTGGLYGIQPARKVVSTDGEWFSNTIIANGNHFAVWVNGYQVSDYFDYRPVMDNGDGKNGFVPDAGTIHLQGHDPTTDLNFRDIHIQEYSAE